MEYDDDLDETERGTYEDRMLAHADRQTSALESLRMYVGWLLAIVIVPIVLALIATVAASG